MTNREYWQTKTGHMRQIIDELQGELELKRSTIKMLEAENRRLDAVASERWHQLKAEEKLTRQLAKSLKALVYIAKTDTGPVHAQLRRDIREAEKLLEFVASRKRERRARP